MIFALFFTFLKRKGEYIMKYFRIELIFRGTSETIVEMALGVDFEVHNTNARGSWDFEFLGEKPGPAGTKMAEYKVVTPLLTRYDLDVLTDLLETLGQIGCIVGNDRPVKIYFLEKPSKGVTKKYFSEREAKGILSDLVRKNIIFRTLLLYRKNYLKLPFYSKHCKPDGKEFVSYKAFYSAIKSPAVDLILESFLTHILLKGARPSNI